MAKPISVAEDEALKFYRLQNILTPPAIVELSDLDREMSDILSRNDLSAQERARQYYKALIKFQNIYKDYFPSVAATLESKNKKEKEKEKESEKPIPFKIPLLQMQTDAEIEQEDEEIKKEEKLEKKQESGVSTLIPRAKKIESNIMKNPDMNMKRLKGYVVINDPQRKKEVRKIPEGLWNKTLNYLAYSSASKLPQWKGKKMKKITEFISQSLIRNKIVNKTEMEKFPNMSHIMENISNPKNKRKSMASYSPAKSTASTPSLPVSPTQDEPIDQNSLNNTADFMSEEENFPADSGNYDEKFAGSGMHVKFNKWNKTVHDL
jgi:hypothetical protein